MEKTMRQKLFLGFALALCASATGCFDVFSDALIFHHGGQDEIGGTGGTGGTGTGGTGGTTTIDPKCVPSDTSEPVDDDCGVFVSSSIGKNTNSGTKKDEAFETLDKAIQEANGRPIYVCAETFSESLTLTEDATFYGGLDCKNGWAYVGATTRTDWTAPADVVPLRLLTGTRAELQDFVLVAANATSAGGSSIGVIAEAGTQLALLRCDVNAGTGAKGADGEAPAGNGTKGEDGKDGTGTCTNQGEFGASGGQLICGMASVAGGDGGNGTKNLAGGAGSPGQPELVGSGLGGKGQQDTPATDCTVGGNGVAGMPGDPGLGAPMSLGTLSPDGYAGAPGNDGKSGVPGQGGGGGGGAKFCAVNAGPSGGGGGSGGCGGAGGKAGQAGGASIGILSLNAKLTLDAVNISTQAGGNGGAGANGQPGGAGGIGGVPGPVGMSAVACAGGKGGEGGPGGRGGGGRGGHSFGIAHKGEAPNTEAATITNGTLGDGGEGDGAMGKGAPGEAGTAREFPM